VMSAGAVLGPRTQGLIRSKSMRYRRQLPLLSVFISALLILAACGGGGGNGKDASTDPTPPPTSSIDTATPDGSATTQGVANAPVLTMVTDTGAPITKEVKAPTGPAPTVMPTFTSTFDADGDGFYTYDELEQAVTQLMATYTWPPNYLVTPELMLRGFQSDPNIHRGQPFQVKYEYTLVGFFHLCDWERTWLDAYRDGDQKLLKASVYQLQTVAPENIVFKENPDHVKEIGDSAALGNPAPIQNEVDTFCKSGYPYITPVSGTPPVGPSLPAETPATTGFILPTRANHTERLLF